MAGNEVSQLYVRIGTNLSGLTSGLSKAFSAIGGFAKQVGSVALGTILAKGIGGAFSMVANGIGDSISNASTLNETLSKTDVLLGNSADQAKKFSAALESKGLGSQAEILESYLASVNQLTNQGVGKQMAQNLAEQLEVRVGDLASQDNADPKMIRENLASAMAGEFQILRKYGVDASAEDQQASGKTRSEYVISKFMAKTKRSEGDFDRTKYGYANLSRASDTKGTAASTRIGQDLLVVGQAFQYFRGKFMLQILAIANSGAFKRFGDTLYKGISYIGMAIEMALPAIVEILIAGATKLADIISFAASLVAAVISKPKEAWEVVVASITLGLLAIKDAFFLMANKLSMGLIGKGDRSAEKQAAMESLNANKAVLDEEKGKMDVQMQEMLKKFTESTGSGTGAGALGMNAPAATSMKASSSAFNSLLSGVFAQKPDKQLGVLQQIATNTAPKDTGAAPVTNKATLATPKTGGGIL
jgi:hypothetical protein